MKKGRIYTNDHGDHGQLAKINEHASNSCGSC